MAVTTKDTALYAKLEERILARDQLGASAIFYDLVRAERPLAEIVGETVRIHAPYTHVPFHQRIDDGNLGAGGFGLFEIRHEMNI